MGIFVTYADNSFLSREYHPEQRLLKPFFFYFLPHMVPQGPQSLTPKWHFFKDFGCFCYPNKKEAVIDICEKSVDVYKLNRPRGDRVGQKIKKWF